MNRYTGRGKILEIFYKEDILRCLKENYDINDFKYILNLNDTEKDTVLDILHKGMKKDLNTLLFKIYQKTNTTEKYKNNNRVIFYSLINEEKHATLPLNIKVVNIPLVNMEK